MLTDDVGHCVDLLRAGGLVALPTETVYGLGADAENPDAVARVYAAKGRPADHPLIVHLADAAAVDDGWAVDVPPWARLLAAACWPGPLTLVLPRGPRAGLHVTGGQGTVGLRVPAHPVAHALLSAFGGGVAAPSANRFGRVSPTDAEHVLDELAGVLEPGRDAVLVGGPSEVGVESTIVDCTGPAPRLLRPGAVGALEVEAVTGLDLVAPDAGVRAPGTLAAHYAPSAEIVLADAAAAAGAVAAAAPPVGLLAPADVDAPVGAVRLAAPADAAAYARALYAALRRADVEGLRTVVAVAPEGGPLAAAVLDRLRRAAVGSARH
ncbi:MAG: threonylcarbamoyl-AMP synthase [Frankiales bacterium]|nr:threonylcarbamoyl-AMP synthase [Frankiales bacterium]